MNEIKNFTIYNEMFRLIDTIQPVEKRDIFLGKLMDFYYKDKKPNFEPNSYEEIIWLNISKPIISYKSKVVNGSKGGRPKKTETKTEIKSKMQSESKTTSDVDVDVNVYVNNKLNIYEYVESNFRRTLSPIEMEKIKTWTDNELTRYAVAVAVLNGVNNLKYVEAILENWKMENITTVEQAKKQNKKLKEKVPEWFDQNVEKEKITQAEEDELKELLGNYG